MYAIVDKKEIQVLFSTEDSQKAEKVLEMFNDVEHIRFDVINTSNYPLPEVLADLQELKDYYEIQGIKSETLNYPSPEGFTELLKQL